MSTEIKYTKDVSVISNFANRSDWKCELFGTNGALTLHPRKDQVPNWFWRKMQYLILGNRWIKEKQS